ncbi:hypothetical protein HDV00_012450 [Rhizophlyctis rosea]|nr:hypothetical protein HDV00_012450 [Rhizophlyctis rosea]
MMDYSAIRERCIKVFGTDNQSHIIDVGKLPDAQSIREKILKKFGIRGDEEKQMYGLYGLDFMGVLDTGGLRFWFGCWLRVGEHHLSNEQLLEICKSPNSHLKAHLVLKKLPWFDFGTEIVPSEAQLTPPSGNSSPTERTPTSAVMGELDLGGRKKMKHQASLRRLRSFFSGSNSSLVSDSEKEEKKDAVPKLKLPPPQRRKRIDPPPPTPLDGVKPESVLSDATTLVLPIPTMQARERTPSLSSSAPLPPVVPRVPTQKKLERFFGERPPSEMICDNLERFFPGIQHVDVEVIEEHAEEMEEFASSDFDGGGGGGMGSGDGGFVVGSVGSVSGRRMRHRSVKQMVEENILVKRLSQHKASGVGGTNTSFGRRLSRLEPGGGGMRPRASRAVTIDGTSGSMSVSKSVREEWRDRIASIDEEGSVVTGRDAEWAPVPVFGGVQVGGGGSDGELEKSGSLRRKSLGREEGGGGVRRDAIRPRPESIIFKEEFVESLRRRRSEGDLESVRGRDVTVDDLKEMAASMDSLGSKSKSATTSTSETRLPGSSPPKDSSSRRSVRLRPSTESLQSTRTGPRRTSLRMRISQEILRTSTSQTSFHRFSTETTSRDSLPEGASKSLSDVASIASFTSNIPDSPSGSISLGSLPRRPTLTRAFTNAPDTPRPVDWIKGDLIGSGSFGRVYYGVNVTTGEIMAVKQVELASPNSLPPKAHAAGGIHALRKRMVDALHREITLLKDLNHENIVRYLGYDVQGNMINVFLEYVSGGSVASSIARMGKFEEGLVRSVTCQVLSGLEYLHERSIIHRDIKGGNILLDENGVAKISDFGISKKNEYKMAYRYNSRMSIQGSVYWMAPEVIKAKGYSAKVDIWSLGCVVLEMFTGGHPWQKLDELQTMWRLGRENRPDVPDGVGEEGRAFVGKCFTIDPDERPTATALLTDPFADIDPAEFDFKACKERALERLRREEEEDNDDELDIGDSWIGTDAGGGGGTGIAGGMTYSSTVGDEGTMLNSGSSTPTTGGGGGNGRNSRRGSGAMVIARVASAKMMDGFTLGFKTKSVRKSGLRSETRLGGDDGEEGTGTGTGSDFGSEGGDDGGGDGGRTPRGTQGELTPLTGDTVVGPGTGSVLTEMIGETVVGTFADGEAGDEVEVGEDGDQKVMEDPGASVVGLAQTASDPFLSKDAPTGAKFFVGDESGAESDAVA